MKSSSIDDLTATGTSSIGEGGNGSSRSRLFHENPQSHSSHDRWSFNEHLKSREPGLRHRLEGSSRRRENPPRPSSAARAAALLVLLLLATFAATPARAQTTIPVQGQQDIAFVSNLNQRLDARPEIGREDTAGQKSYNQRGAQVFSTGNAASGYKLSSVVFNLVDYEEIDGEHLKATLHLFGDEGNPIGTKILDFANPTTYSTVFGGGPRTFVPADGTSEESRTLLPNTSYVISFRLPNPRTLRWFTVDATESDSETQRSNWSIANKSYWKRAGWGWSTRRDSMKMKVLGTLVRPTAEVRGPMGTPEITGVAQVGDTLEATFAEVPIGTLTWQWMRGSKNIAGAEASTYTLTEEDVGVRFSVRVERGGESVVSAPTGPVWPAPANTPLADGEEELLLATVTLESYKSGVRSAGYGRIRDQSFGAMDNTSFEDGGTTYAVEQLFVIADGYFTIATDSRLPTPEGLVAYWNGYRITGLARTGGGGLLVGRSPQPETEYLRYWDGASDGVRVAVSLRRVRAAARVTGASVTSGPGENGVWDAGERVEAEVRFSRTVGVYGPPGAKPTIGITLGGTRHDARYVTGSGTDTLRFEYAVTAADDGATRARVVANSLNTNGNILGDKEGEEAELGFSVAPYVTRVVLAADASGDGVWSPGERVEVRLVFSEAVTVTGARPWLEVSVGGLPVMLSYVSGSGSATLVFSTEVPDGGRGLTGVTVVADSLNANRATIVSEAAGLAAELGHEGAEAAEAEAVQLEPNSVTAEFLNWPAEHNRREFTFKIRFSKGFSLSYLTLRDHALSVTNGALNDVSRVNRQGEEKDWEWNVTVTPDGSENVTVTLAATTDCTAAGAICTADGWPLSPAVTVVVPETAASFTVKFEDDHAPPDTHDGTTPIVFRIAFSKESRGYSYKTLRDHTLSIWQGQSLNATAVRRLEQGSNKRWEVTIDPVSRDDLTVGIGPTSSCNDAGAVCAEGGQMLANSIRKVIKGPPGISVADARVEEAADATVDFMVSLNRESTSTVTVDYATSDATAIAGEDYTQTSGTLTFAAGETEKTVSVAVLDDGHDEGEETFTLTLSNPSGGNAWLKDATATGTIENTDAMPRAWLARFGRTVAEHVIEGVRSRLSGSRSPGVRTEFADYEPLREGDEQILKHDDNLAFYEWVSGESWRRTELRELSGRDILDVGAFSVTSGESSSGFLSLWGRAALSRFDGRDADVTVDGEVRTFSLGADWSSGPLTAGLSLSRSGGDGGWTFEGEGGSVESSLTGVYPYVGYELTDRLSVWGVGGYARGEIELRMPGGTETVRADADMSMAAVGARGDIVSGAAGTLALEADALFARTGSEAAEGIVAASEADVSRLRLALTGSYSRSLGETLLTPSLEAGVRRDGGDAETGFGVDLGGGISVSSPARGLSLELKVRGLLAHESGGFEQWGTSVSVLWDPDPSTERGMRIFLGRTLGAESSGGAEALFRRVTLEELGREGGSGGLGQFEAEAGYGLGAFGGRGTFSPYVGLASQDAPGREWRGGGRLRLGSVEGALTGTLSEGGGYGREAGVSLSVRIPLGGAGAVESSFVNGSLYSE